MAVLDSRDDCLRISDADRQAAYDALGSHLRAGRLGPHEYVDRMEVCAVARTAADLAPQFEDLPWPSPFRLQPVEASRRLPAPAYAPRTHGPSWVKRLNPLQVARLAALVLVLSGLGLGAHIWGVFLFLFLVLLVCGRRRVGRDPRNGPRPGDRFSHDRFVTQVRPPA